MNLDNSRNNFNIYIYSRIIVKANKLFNFETSSIFLDNCREYALYWF